MTFARTTVADYTENSSSTTVATPSYTSTAGRLIAGYVAWEGGNTTVGVADTAGNTYVVGTPIPHGTTPDQVIAAFYSLSSLGHASNIVTATFGAARSVRVIQLAEYSAAGAITYDGTANGYSTSTGPATTGNITTTGAVGLLFAGVKGYNNTSLTASAPLTLISQIGNFGADGERFLTSAATYTATMSSSASAICSIVALAFKEGATDPTVTSVTSSGVAEGGNLVFTVTLSGATNRETNYAFSLGGTATAGTDYTSPLTSGMCNNSVTVSGGDFVVPDATSSWTVTIPTTQDTTDEDNETIVLTVGGTASTGGTITDDDALPSITITPSITVDGGDSVVITCTLGAVSGRVTQARLVLADGTKVGGVDYTNVITDPMLSDGVTISAGVLSIPAGVVSFTITIPTTP